MRFLPAYLILLLPLLACPLNAQPVPEGDEVRVREAKNAPWSTGLYAGNDSASLVLVQNGVERVYQLASLERVDWHKQKHLGLGLLIGAGGGALLGLVTGAILCSGDGDDYFDCSGGTVAQAAALTAAIGAGLVLLDYAIWPREWKNVTERYPPAGDER